MIELTRRATFSASHYYWNDAWSPEKNEEVFGRCARRNGHGHNYTLEVTVSGDPDPVTGLRRRPQMAQGRDRKRGAGGV